MARAKDPDKALIDAAIAVSRAGEALTIAAVAERAGVSRAAVYRRFADREALLAAVVASGRLRSPPAEARPTRERILDAVGVLLGQQGLSATTIDAVAAEAGVGAATVYRQFVDRKGLLGAFVTERTPRKLVASFRRTGDAEADLLALTVASLAFLREHRGLFALLWSADPEAVELFAELRGGSDTVRGLMAKIVHAGWPDPTGRTLAAYTGLLFGVAWGAAGEPEEDARFVVAAFLRGAAR